MKISVILCTYNRCQSLAKALDSVAAQVLPESVEWEVLVVDNNSSDQTREVVEHFSRQYPGRFRYLFEPQPGKSYALNAAVCKARGDILAFIDDDVTLEPQWLQNLTAPLHDSKWAGSGGRVVPQWFCSPPRWISREGPHPMAPLAVFDRGDEATELTEPPFGTNMAYRKAMFQKYGAFRTDLGPSPNPDTPRPNEDTEFGRRLLAAGERLRYEPSAVVHHSVEKSRLTKEYFLAWWFDKGRADIRECGFPSGTRWFIGKIPLYMFRRIAVWTFKWMINVEQSRRFFCKLNVWFIAGEIQESYCRRGAHREGERGGVVHQMSTPRL